MDVIGVGGINFEDHIARFSSRGMTTWVRLCTAKVMLTSHKCIQSTTVLFCNFQQDMLHVLLDQNLFATVVVILSVKFSFSFVQYSLP